MKLLRVEKSPNPDKKYRAVFETETGRTKHTDFGDSSASDYLQHRDKERRERYRDRHRKDLETNDPTRAGYLSYYLLWGDYTSLRSNIDAYKKRFNL